jgi:hypothetical protein
VGFAISNPCPSVCIRGFKMNRSGREEGRGEGEPRALAKSMHRFIVMIVVRESGLTGMPRVGMIPPHENHALPFRNRSRYGYDRSR